MLFFPAPKATKLLCDSHGLGLGGSSGSAAAVAVPVVSAPAAIALLGAVHQG